MCLHDPLRDRETQPEAAAIERPRGVTRGTSTRAATRAHAIRAPETLEYVRKIAGGDADAGVANGERDFAMGSPRQTDVHVTAARRVLDRVGREVQEQMTQAAR